MFGFRSTLRLWIMAMVAVNHESATTTRPQEIDYIQHVNVVLGNNAELPCDTQSIKNSTEWPILIIWYRGQDRPIYSVDQRERAAGGRRWSDRSVAQRVRYAENDRGMAVLIIENVRESDGGQYRCREDFKYSPTRNNFVRLDVITPPYRLEIVDNESDAVWNSTLPPILEHGKLEILCKSYGGNPLPRVTWNVRGDSPNDPGGVPLDGKTVANVLRVDRVHRDDNGKLLVCEASNVPDTVQLSTSVTMNVYLKPLNVAIAGAEHPFLSGEPISLDCVSYGSRPAANITWYHNGQVIGHETRRIKVVENNNMTWSTLKMVPTDDDDQSVISCVASNVFFPAYPKEQQITLNVHYPPRLKITLGRNLNASNIKENSDVYFECHVKASPAIVRLDWDHNGTSVGLHESRRTIVSNQTLVLQSITRKGSGSYRCAASNARGKSISNAYHLDVKYEPSCAADQQHVYGAHKGETARIVCGVDGNPAPGSFRWAFNGSSASGLIDVTGPDRGASAIRFRVLDFGTLLCWATNPLATQSRPCVYHIVPAGRPDPPRNCTPVNVTSTRFTVQCEPGYGGGLPQRIACAVAATDRPDVPEASADGQPGRAAVEVTGLRPSTQYVATVYARNAKGSSAGHVRVYVETLPNPKDPRVAGDSTSTATRFSDAAQVGILLLGCCFVGVCATAAVYAKRSASRQRRTVDERPPGTAIEGDGSGPKIGLKTQIKVHKSLQNGQYNEIATGSPYSVLTTPDINNTLRSSKPLEGHANDASYNGWPRTRNGDLRPNGGARDSFVAFNPSRKSISTGPTADVESIV